MIPKFKDYQKLNETAQFSVSYEQEDEKVRKDMQRYEEHFANKYNLAVSPITISKITGTFMDDWMELEVHLNDMFGTWIYFTNNESTKFSNYVVENIFGVFPYNDVANKIFKKSEGKSYTEFMMEVFEEWLADKNKKRR